MPQINSSFATNCMIYNVVFNIRQGSAHNTAQGNWLPMITTMDVGTAGKVCGDIFFSDTVFILPHDVTPLFLSVQITNIYM